MLQMLQNIQNQRIHIINLGFESDWITKSFDKTRPDKIYLVRKNKEDARAELTEKIIQKYASKKGLEIEYIINEIDINLLVKQLKEVFEKEKGNNVYLAISAGPRYNTSAFIISSMLFGKYAREVFLYSLEDGGYIELPRFEVKLPKPEIIASIKFLADQKDGCVKKELRDYVFNNNILKIGKCKDKEHTQYVKLNRAILDSAEKDWKLIQIDGNRKGSKITLTEEGKKWARIFQ
jgi:hypothetical protein